MADQVIPGVERWLQTNDQDSRIEHYMATYQKWHDAIPEEIWPIAEQMINCFEYYGHRRINAALAILNSQLVDKFDVDSHTALFTYINEKNGKLNSSHDYWGEFRIIAQISKENCTDDLRKFASKYWELVTCIVIVDDCCGSGNSLKTYIEESGLDFTGKVLYYLVIHAMDESRDLLARVAAEQNMTIHLLSLNTSSKFFSTDMTEEKEHFIEKMNELKIINNPLGFNDSEALIAFANNTPNNTFPLFHKTTSKITAVFPRKEKQDNIWDSMKKGAKRRKAQNYSALAREKANG